MATKPNQTNTAADAAETIETIDIVVTARFRDKNDHETWYEVGDELQFEKERAENLIERGLAELKPEPVVEG
jgi:hypothetical protein